MPIIIKPNTPGNVLVSVPVPQPVATPLRVPRPIVPQPVARPTPQQAPQSIEHLFVPMRAPPVMLLPHAELPPRATQFGADGSRVRMGQAVDDDMMNEWHGLRDVLRAFHDRRESVPACWVERARELKRLLFGARNQQQSTGRYQAPTGGMVVRGVFYPGGKLLPKMATRPAARMSQAGDTDSLDQWHNKIAEWLDIIETLRGLRSRNERAPAYLVDRARSLWSELFFNRGSDRMRFEADGDGNGEPAHATDDVSAPHIDCPDCGRHTPLDDTIIGSTGIGRVGHRPVCRDCGDANYWSCADCGDLYHHDTRSESWQNAHREPVCEECGSQYSDCDVCERPHRPNDPSDRGQVDGVACCGQCVKDHQHKLHIDRLLDDEGYRASQEVHLPSPRLFEQTQWLSDPHGAKVYGDIEHIHEMLGKSIDAETFAHLFGLVDGHVAIVRSHPPHPFLSWPVYNLADPRRPILTVNSAHPDHDQDFLRYDDWNNIAHSGAQVSLLRDEEGNLHCSNDFVGMGKLAGSLHGHGRAVVRKQIEALRKIGAKRIHQGFAIGGEQRFWMPRVANPDPNNEAHWARTQFIGGRVWPLFGFGGALPEHSIQQMPKQLVDQLGERPDVRDLLDLPGGKEWWKQNAFSIPDGYMDLDPRSRTGEAHENAWAEMQQRIGKLEQRRGVR